MVKASPPPMAQIGEERLLWGGGLRGLSPSKNFLHFILSLFHIMK